MALLVAEPGRLASGPEREGVWRMWVDIGVGRVMMGFNEGAFEVDRWWCWQTRLSDKGNSKKESQIPRMRRLQLLDKTTSATTWLAYTDSDAACPKCRSGRCNSCAGQWPSLLGKMGEQQDGGFGGWRPARRRGPGQLLVADRSCTTGDTRGQRGRVGFTNSQVWLGLSQLLPDTRALIAACDNVNPHADGLDAN